MNTKTKHYTVNKHILRFAAVILLVPILAVSPMFAGTALGGIIPKSESFYVADEANVISSGTEKYIIEKNAELEALCGGQIVVATVDFLDGLDIEDYAYKLFKEWQIGDEDRNNGILLLLAIGEENYWCMQGKGLERSLTSGDIDDILWNYLEDDFAAGDYDSGIRSVFDALYDCVSDIYGVSGTDGGSEDNDYDYTTVTDNFAQIVKMVLIVFLVILILLIITSVFFGKRNKNSSRGSVPGSDYNKPQTSRTKNRPIFIPAPRPSRSSPASRPARTSRTKVTGSRPGSSRSSFSGGSSSRGNGMGCGGGGSSRGGGAGRRGR